MVTLVTTLVLLIAWQAQRANDQPGRWRWLALGLLVGACALARGNVLLLLLLLPILLWRRPDVPRARAWRLVGWLWLGAAATIAPVTVRNVLVGGDLVVLTSNLGLNLFIGQQAEYGGRFGTPTDDARFEFDRTGRILLEAEAGRGLAPSEISRELTRRAVARVVDEPGAMVAHYARKAYRFWSGYELPQIYSWTFWRARSPALRAAFVPAVVLLAAGLVGVWTLRRPVRRLWLIMVGGWFLSLLPFFPTARYRLPIMPLVAIAAVAWLAALVTSVRTRAWRRTALLTAAMLVLLVALWPTWSRYDPQEELWYGHLNRARRAAEVNDVATLTAACADAERVRPGLAETPYRQGGFLTHAGDRQGALAAYQEAARRAPDDAFTTYRVGATLAALGRHREALMWYGRAVSADPTWALPHLGRAESLRLLRAPEQAIAAMRRAVAREPGRARYRSNLASLLAETGRRDEALAILRELTRDFPDYGPGWFNLAVAELQAGDQAAARRALERAAALPDLDPAQRQRIDALRERLR
jgi:tetratricopeptide (TPR) repeat protein